MPIIQKFQLQNFKGIEQVEIDLLGRASCPVITLIGLNESGKTTILEGISHFVSGDRSVSGLFEGAHATASGAALIPVHKKAAFTDHVKISGIVELDEKDIEAIVSIAKKHRLEVDLASLEEPFQVSKILTFEDSLLKKSTNYWYVKLRTRAQKRSQFKEYERPSEPDSDLWLQTVNLIGERLPQVSYFPTFLVDMPKRIYLRENDQEKAINRHYRLVFQDILDSLKSGLSLEKHVCDRVSKFKESGEGASWFSSFTRNPIKESIDSVFQKISHAVTREVLGSWQRVFQRAISAKSISVEWNIDTERDDMPYASFYVSDGESRYAISERSLGFRWFFSFLLFTAFKQAKQRKTIFIFDEPAANLHARAQAELLTSFSRIASDGNQVIYSTHSHHMINPRWLSGAYIVENTALDYDIGDSFGLSTKPTNIRTISYRQFVSAYPSRSSYFQPVIEKLEYVSPEVIGDAPYLMVEGISDYYALKLVERILPKRLKFRLIPGVGAGSSGPLVSQLIGRGERFVILLDDDKAGKREAARYIEDWFLLKDVVLTLGDIDSTFVGMRIEGLLGSETLRIIQVHLGSDSKPTKRQIGWYLAEMCASNELCDNCLSQEAVVNLQKVLIYVESLFRLNDLGRRA